MENQSHSYRLTAKSGVLIVADHGHIRDNASLDPAGSNQRCQRRREGGDQRQEGRARRKHHLRRVRPTNRPTDRACDRVSFPWNVEADFFS